MAVVHDPETKSFSIQRNEDGSVTLSIEEYEEFANSYNAIYERLDGVTCIGDYFDPEFFYSAVKKWHVMTEYGAYGPEEYDPYGDGRFFGLNDEDEDEEEDEAS